MDNCTDAHGREDEGTDKTRGSVARPAKTSFTEEREYGEYQYRKPKEEKSTGSLLLFSAPFAYSRPRIIY